MKWIAFLLFAGVRFSGAWTTTIDWPQGPPPASYPTGALSDSTSSTFNGPATLAFDWRLKQAPAPEWSLDASYMQAKLDGVSVMSLSPNRLASDDTMSTASINIPAGQHTVTWTATGDPAGRWPVFSITADVTNVRIVDPAAELAQGLDTTLTISNPTGWAKNAASGWRGGNRISLGAGSGGFSAQVTGPAVLAFRSTIEGMNDIGFGSRGFLRITIPGSPVHDVTPTSQNNVSEDLHTRAFLIPAGTHIISWSGQGAGFPAMTWHMDALEVSTPADFATALNNTLTWTVTGNAAHVPRVDASVSHDGTAAVRLPGKAGFFDQSTATGAVTTQINGPAVIAWWHRTELNAGMITVTVDGAIPPGLLTPGSQWQRQVLRIPAGSHAVSILRDPVNLWAEGEAWVDQFTVLPPFETWLAGFLTDAELLDPAKFSRDADQDGDGLSALMEYALQTSPVAPSTGRLPVLVRDATDPGLLRFMWRESTAAVGVTFTAQKSADLTQWENLPAVQTGIEGTDRLMQATVPITPGRQLVRLRVE